MFIFFRSLKKPPNAYILYFKKVFNDLINDSAFKNKDNNADMKLISKRIGFQWKNLDHSEKKIYEDEHKRLMEEYKKELKASKVDENRCFGDDDQRIFLLTCLENIKDQLKILEGRINVMFNKR